MNKKEVCTGLKVTKRDDGHWITFTGNGREASLHVESYLHGGVLQDAVIDWIEKQFDKPEPKQPSHEEIWNNAWRISDNVWSRVTDYNAKTGCYYICEDWKNKGYFTGRESSTIPPEIVR